MATGAKAVIVGVMGLCAAFGQQPPPMPPPGSSASLQQTPTFKDYPVQQVYTGKVALPKFRKGNFETLPFPDGDLRCIGTDDGEHALFFANKKVNFAGKYVIDACTCGSGCHYLFMWDAQTGKMFRTFPFGTVEIGPYLNAKPVIEYSGEHYKVDSTLLIVEGCFDTDSHPKSRDCARYYYNWTGQGFVRFYKQRTRVPPPIR
jgi:hypothetical protein